jgi:hypothetical protein
MSSGNRSGKASGAAARPRATTPYSTSRSASSTGAQRLTTDDLRHKALAVRDVATDEARHLLQRNRVRLIIAGAVVVAVGFSVAYHLGSRAGARARARARR